MKCEHCGKEIQANELLYDIAVSGGTRPEVMEKDWLQPELFDIVFETYLCEQCAEELSQWFKGDKR